jgi:TonB family protein
LPDGTILVTHTKDYSPFSWMRYIIVSERDLRGNRDMILAHERAHIRLGHSWDLLFAQLCATMQWFNPAAWLLKRELEAIHEYEADNDTLRQGFDARQYQLRLFEAASGVKYSSFTNNFTNCSTKKRIIMMMKKQTSPWALFRALYVLPVAFAAVSVISCTSPKEKKSDANQEVVQQEQPASAPEIQVVTYAPQPKEVEQGEIFQVVEERPQFPGGDAELMKFLQQNVKYPKEAQEQGKQGRVIVQFVVEKDGSITDAKVLKPVDPLLDAEALRIVNMMPKWTPGKQRGKAVRVYFTIPVTFRLSN